MLPGITEIRCRLEELYARKPDTPPVKRIGVESGLPGAERTGAPLVVGDHDLVALHLDGGHGDSGPRYQQVNLVIIAAVAILYGMGQDVLIRKAVL